MGANRMVDLILKEIVYFIVVQKPVYLLVDIEMLVLIYLGHPAGPAGQIHSHSSLATTNIIHRNRRKRKID